MIAVFSCSSSHSVPAPASSRKAAWAQSSLKHACHSCSSRLAISYPAPVAQTQTETEKPSRPKLGALFLLLVACSSNTTSGDQAIYLQESASNHCSPGLKQWHFSRPV